MVHVQKTMAKSGITTHCSFGTVVYVQTNTINLRILPYKCFMMRKFLSSFTDIPYKAGTVNHATKRNVEDYDRSILGWYGQPCHEE